MRIKTAILFIIVFLIGSVATTAAANDQGLSWGVEVGDRINYRMHGENVNGVTPVIDWDIYMQVDSVDALDETVTSFSQIPMDAPSISTYWSNGTSYYLGLPLMVFPIGNWSLLEDLILDYSAYILEEYIVETESTWGYTVTQDFLGSSQTTTAIYSKTDGVINYHKILSIYEGETPNQLVEIIREGYSPPGGFDSNMLLYIGVGAGAIVILVVVFIRRR